MKKGESWRKKGRNGKITPYIEKEYHTLYEGRAADAKTKSRRHKQAEPPRQEVHVAALI